MRASERDPVRNVEPRDADAIVKTDPTTLVRWVYGKRPIADAEAEGTMRIDGRRDLAARFADLFALPPKLPVE